MGQLYTIGHSTYPEEHFTELAKHFELDYILDVRSTPYSRFTPQYNQELIKHTLEKENIKYAPMGKYFGARQPDQTCYPNGYLDFELFRKSELFIAGVANVIKGLEKHNIALMCAEKNPIDCHRAIMVARGFALAGVSVEHILHDFTLLSQAQLDEMLLEKYFPDRNQLSFFVEENKTEEEYLKEAYAKRNAEIGYRPGTGSEGGQT